MPFSAVPSTATRRRAPREAGNGRQPAKRWARRFERQARVFIQFTENCLAHPGGGPLIQCVSLGLRCVQACERAEALFSGRTSSSRRLKAVLRCARECDRLAGACGRLRAADLDSSLWRSVAVRWGRECKTMASVLKEAKARKVVSRGTNPRPRLITAIPSP